MLFYEITVVQKYFYSVMYSCSSMLFYEIIVVQKYFYSVNFLQLSKNVSSEIFKLSLIYIISNKDDKSA